MRLIKVKHREKKNYTLRKKEKKERKTKKNQSKYKVLMLKSSHKKKQ